MASLKNFEFVDSNVPLTKMKDYLFTADDVIGIQSRLYYARAENKLEYYTIAENEEVYKNKIAEMIEEFSSLNDKGTTITILELGGGTGKFCTYLTNYLQGKGIQYEYTIVDISTKQYSSVIKEKKEVTIVEDSFTNFATKNKKRFDILIMNEALDMWAGKQEVLDVWSSEQLPVEVFWILADLERKKYIKKKEAGKLHSELEKNYVWQQVYYSKDNKSYIQEKGEDWQVKIHLPETFEQLLQQINLVAIVQDYWAFEEQENTIRMGLKDESTTKTLATMSHVTKEQSEMLKKLWEQELKKTNDIHKWIISPIIPLGIVDVTYSPDQSELLDTALNLGLDMMTTFAQGPVQFGDKMYNMGEEENEIFILFTKKAVELRFKS